MFKFGSLVLVCLAFIALTVPAAAGTLGFSGYFAPDNWSFGSGNTNGTVDVTGAPDSIIVYGPSNPDYPGGDRFLIQAPTNGTVSFSWAFEDLPNKTDSTLYSYENWNPIYITTAVGDSGTHSFNIDAGQWFGFGVGGSGLSSPFATISSFEFASTVPEPSSLAMLGLGCLALGLLRRKRAQRQRKNHESRRPKTGHACLEGHVCATAHPNLLVPAGLNDPRVSYWEPAKWVAKLRASTPNSKLLLLKTNMGAGHFGASGRYERYKETALDYAFLLKAVGAELQ